MTINSESIFIGTMSGTSMDGLDLAAVTFNNNLPQLLYQQNIAYPEELRILLQNIAIHPEATITQSCELDTRLGLFYADSINTFIHNNNIDRLKIAAIGSHGQTLRHSIQPKLSYTLQIGDPNIIAANTGLTVVADFRRRDLALGGHGAPLAPAFHNQVFRNDKTNRVIVNIGGITNITNLPADNRTTVIGFDTGPGNTLLDHFSRRYLNKNYDENGDFARTGTANQDLLRTILRNEPYFQRKPPKSTGTDYFSPGWLEQYDIKSLSAADTLATLVELTALSLAEGIRNLTTNTEECFICGGGSHNRYLLERIEHHLEPISVNTTEKLGIHPDWVEAMAFAWLARQTLLLLPGNLPSVTNAKIPTILGGVYFSHRQI